MSTPLVLKSPDNDLVRIKVVGICRRCKRYHHMDVVPDLFGRAAFDWQYKHRACMLEYPEAVEFLSPSRFIPKGFDDRIFNEAGEGPPWLDWKENANAVMNYVADAAFVMDLSALASSSSFTAGMESDAVANSSGYFDFAISGKFISGTTPTAPGETRLYYVRAIEDTPTWPSVFDGSTSAETVTNVNILDGMIKGWSGTVSTASDLTYPIQSALTMSEAFGICPKNFLLFFTHFHTAALKTDAANTNSIFYQGVYPSL